jgi:hypothetical protein
MTGTSQPTIIALERDQSRTLRALDSVARVLGAGLYLAAKGSPKPFYTHAGNSSNGERWETAAALLSALYSVFKRFDLDPCSPRKTKPPVRARLHLTAEDDGLSLPWHGVVFVNPPYGRTLGRWIEKARHEVESGNAKTVVALIPARTDTTYWHRHVAGRAVVFFLQRPANGLGIRELPTYRQGWFRGSEDDSWPRSAPGWLTTGPRKRTSPTGNSTSWTVAVPPAGG